MKGFYCNLSSSVLSGICISIGCIAYLNVGGVAGAVLFAFGLVAVVHHGWELYTGKCGFVSTWRDLGKLSVTLVGNIIGCFLMSLVMKETSPLLTDQAMAVVGSRAAMGIVRCLLMGMGCGFIMTMAVHYAKQGKYLPLLFGVPTFILCGFMHSIADAFYFSMLPWQAVRENTAELLGTYLTVVLGNFIGCNLVRILQFKKEYLD